MTLQLLGKQPPTYIVPSAPNVNCPGSNVAPLTLSEKDEFVRSLFTRMRTSLPSSDSHMYFPDGSLPIATKYRIPPPNLRYSQSPDPLCWTLGTAVVA